MALIQTSLIWVAYAVAVALLLAIASIFVYIYQAPRDRSVSVTLICILTLSALLATVLLLPVDVALVSSTTDVRYGRKKSWATLSRVEGIEQTLKIVYYTLYSLDTILCLLVIPFTYFWYEEGEETEADARRQSKLGRLFAAFKYTVMFVLLVIILFLIGFFIPVAKQTRHSRHMDLDYFKKLLAENHGERALTFSLGLLITIGTIVYVIYTASGMALLPVTLIKSAPSISVPKLVADTASQLEQNRERQRQLERRNNGSDNGLDARDHRELENLIREERTLARRERLGAEASGENENWLVRLWIKLCALFRPVMLIGGLILIIVAILIWTAMLITGIDKAKNSICKADCGYVLGHVNIFQPVNWILVKSAKVFPVDYIIFLLLVLFFFCSSVVGLATVGIRFLWVVLFKIRSGHTSPQALLIATVILTLIVLAINYSITMIVAPQYATFGPQTYCDLEPEYPGEQPDCTHERSFVKSCSEIAENASARHVCTPSIVSTFINRLTVNFPFFGIINFWAQFAFLGVFFVVFVTSLVRTPKMDTSQIDADLEEEEEEGLLASTGRRFNATWQDITGRARNLQSYGAVDENGVN